MKTPFLALLIAFAVAVPAAAAGCGNCHGERIVGPGPVRFVCPVCAGTGTVPDPKPASAAQADDGPTFTAAKAAGDTEPAATPPAAGRPRPVVARVSSARGNERDIGSGVLVRTNGTRAIVLTNWHVVQDNRTGITVAWPDGTTAAGRVVAADRKWDLAAIAVAPPGAPPVPIAAQAPRIGDRLTIAGYGPRGHYLEQTGAVTMYAGPPGRHPPEWVECRAAARSGDSGGPMFNADGELAGVLFGCRDGLTVGSCSTRLRAFLAAVPDEAAEAAEVATPARPAPAAATAKCRNGRCDR
jgi:hypothetical protein